MKLIHAFIYIVCSLSYLNLFSSQKAVITVPIADLLGEQMITIIPDTNTEQAYNAIPVCAGQLKSSMACPRLHQLLYNDMVEVIKIIDDEVYIRIGNAYYVIPSATQPQTNYWTLRKNIVLLEDLTKKNIDIAHIPEPIQFSDAHNTALKCAEIVTLTEPHQDSATHMLFSVGTRFVKKAASQKKRNATIEVFAIDYANMKECTLKIPSHKCMLNDCTKTKEKQIEDFVQLLKKWVHTKHGHIQYVWGGTSFTKKVQTQFQEITKTGHAGDYSFYEYEKDTQFPKNGFDCSGLILRAAQICGIPYFCKNTTTIAQSLIPLSAQQQLKNGDLILIKGHVMVISNLAKNLLIEARSYGHGYGKLHEIPLNRVFEGIQNYKNLTDAYFEKKVVKRMDNKGKIRDTFSNLQLFSMESLWNV